MSTFNTGDLVRISSTGRWARVLTTDMLTCSLAVHVDDTKMSVIETNMIMMSVFFMVGSFSWLIGIERSFIRRLILGRKTVKLKARRGKVF